MIFCHPYRRHALSALSMVEYAPILQVDILEESAATSTILVSSVPCGIILDNFNYFLLLPYY